MSLSTDTQPSKEPTPFLQSELVGRRILDRNTAEELGTVQAIWLSPEYHNAVAITCRSGVMGLKERLFNWTSIDNIGPEAVIVSVLEAVEAEKPDDAERVLGCEVWTDAGNRVGHVLDYVLNSETGDVVAYLFSSDAWGGLASGTYRLPPSAVVSMNGKRLIAHEETLKAAEVHAGNVVQQTRAFLEEDLSQTQQDLSSVVQGAQAIAQQLFSKTQSLSDQGKKRLSGTVEKFQDAQHQLSETVQAKLKSANPDSSDATSASPEAEAEAESPPTDSATNEASEDSKSQS